MGYVRAFVDVWKEIRIQKRFNQTFLLPYLHALEARHQGRFAPEQKQKIVDYYGLFITSFLCSSYKRLYGETLSEAERKRATLFGILTPVGDDFFDMEQLNVAEIEAITFRPNTYNAQTFLGKVAKEIQGFMLDNVPHRDAYLTASAEVLNIQAATIKQTDKSISNEELKEITYTKGAVSVIIYHQCLNEVAGGAMLDALFYIGSLYQLGNDLFDLYKDVRDNIFTLVNTCTDYKAFRDEFIARIRVQNQKIMALPFENRAKQEFCIVMNTINARSLVAIDQLVQAEAQWGKPVDWWQRTRKDMIVDMEKMRNIAKWLYYIRQLPRLR